MLYHIRSTIQLGTQMGTRPRKVPTASTFFSVVATCFPGVPGKLRADLGSSHDSKHFELLTLAGSPKTFRVVKWVLPHAPGTSAGPIARSANFTWLQGPPKVGPKRAKPPPGRTVCVCVYTCRH